MIEVRNITGTGVIDIFPYLSNSEIKGVFQNKLFPLDVESYKNAYIKRLVITNTYTAEIVVNLSSFKMSEDTHGTITRTDYYLLNTVSLPVGASIMLSDDDLCVVDLLKHGLTFKSDTPSSTVSVMYKVSGLQGSYGQKTKYISDIESNFKVQYNNKEI